MRRKFSQVLADWMRPTQRSTASSSGEGDSMSWPNSFPGIALGGGDLRQLLLDEVVQTGLRRFQFVQRHIILVVEIAEAIAGAGPPGVFGERALGLVLLELSD